MATATRSASASAERWSRRASGAGQDYRDGVANTSRSWQRAAAGASANWQAGVTAAAGRNAFATGVNAAGDQRWRDRSQGVGVGRFSEGVQASQQDYASAIAPVLDAIGRVDLPPRGPVGSAGNFQRSSAIGMALRQYRTGTKK